MGHKTHRKHPAIPIFVPLIAIAVFAAVRSHAGYITEQQPITGCQRIQLNPADTSRCNCQANACTGSASATLVEYKSCNEVMPGEQGQRGCKSVARMIGTKGLCTMAINKDVEKKYNRCLSFVWAEMVLCVAVSEPIPLAPLACTAIYFLGVKQCQNDSLTEPCLMLQCVQDPSFRLEITRPVATGFDMTLLPASRQCFGKGE